MKIFQVIAMLSFSSLEGVPHQHDAVQGTMNQDNNLGLDNIILLGILLINSI